MDVRLSFPVTSGVPRPVWLLRGRRHSEPPFERVDRHRDVSAFLEEMKLVQAGQNLVELVQHRAPRRELFVEELRIDHSASCYQEPPNAKSQWVHDGAQSCSSTADQDSGRKSGTDR